MAAPVKPPAECRAVLAALFLTAASGAAGLMHQLVWVRRMVDVLGANAGTFSRVVAAFFLGLAAGAWLAARWRTEHPWRSVAAAEFLVAGLAVVVLMSGEWAQSWQPGPAAARALQWVLPLVLITPPAVAMGAVLPWMMRAIPSRFTVLIYGVNTLGGIAGLGLMVGWALPTLGLFRASIAALALNLLVAAAALWIGRRAPAIDTAAEAGSRVARAPASARRGAAIAFASGFLILGSEVIFQHQFAQLLISSHFSSGLVLALVLAALGVGAFFTPLFARLGRHALPVALALAAVACAVQPLTLIVQRGGLYYLPFTKPLGEYTLAALRVGLLACALPLLGCGLVFPLLLRDAPNPGRLLAVNGLGGWLGAELTERFVGPGFGLWWSMAVFAGGYAVCLAFTTVRWRFWVAPLLILFIGWTWRLDSRLPYAGLTPGDTLIRVALGREGSVGVVRGEPDDWRILFNNTYTLGGSRAQVNQERQTLLPMLLHGDARRIATLGTATGSSLAGATLDPNMQEAEGIELSPLVLRFAREYFGSFNRHVAENPRVRFTIGDARIVIAQRPATFDVIEGDLFLPWRTGESRLFAREHFAQVRRALRPGGLYCQWLPMYQLTRPQFETIARTFREIFPEAWIVRGDFYTAMPILGLVGGRSVESIEWEKVRAACERVRVDGSCRDPLLRHVEGVAMLVVGPVPEPPPGPVNTLANSWLEWDAARNVIGQREPWFTGIPCATYLRDIHRATTPLLPGPLRDAHAAGQWFHTLEIARAAHLPQAAPLTAERHAHLPEALREDSGASWREWPMHDRPAMP
jgi:predicted membrane-bound spermidine synthase